MRLLHTALAVLLAAAPLGALAAPAHPGGRPPAEHPVGFRIGPNTQRVIVHLDRPRAYRVCNDRSSEAPLVVSFDVVNRRGLEPGDCTKIRAKLVVVENDAEIESDEHPERNRDIASGSFTAMGAGGDQAAAR